MTIELKEVSLEYADDVAYREKDDETLEKIEYKKYWLLVIFENEEKTQQVYKKIDLDALIDDEDGRLTQLLIENVYKAFARHKKINN